MVGSRVIVFSSDIVMVIVIVGFIVENIFSLVNIIVRNVMVMVVVDVVIILLMDINVFLIVMFDFLLWCI